METKTNTGPGRGVLGNAGFTLLVIALSFLCGLFSGVLLMGKKNTGAAETYAAAEVQKDSSLVLERRPDGKPEPAPHAIPKGGEEVRRIQVVVEPAQGFEMPKNDAEAGRLAKDSTPAARCYCPPTTVDLSLVKMPDQSMRAVVSSPDGRVLSGVDIPIAGIAQEQASRPWTGKVLLAVDGTSIRPGIGLERVFLKRIRVGAGMVAETSLHRPLMLASAGLDF